MLYIFLTVLSGFSLILSRILNANLSLKIGIYQSTLMNYIWGLATSVIVMLIARNRLVIDSGIPFWVFVGGALGVLAITLSSYITHRVSNFNITLLIFIGQLVTGAVIDLLLGNPISTMKIVGGIIIIAGLAVNILIDRQESGRQDSDLTIPD